MSRAEVSKKVVLLNSMSSAASLVLGLTLIVWLQQYLIKRVSPEEYSLLPVVMAMLAFMPLVSAVLVGGIGRYLTIAYSRDDDAEITRISSTMFPLLCCAAVLILILGAGLVWKVQSLLGLADSQVNDARSMLTILFVGAAVELPMQSMSAGFIVRQKLMQLDLLDFFAHLLRFAILFSLLFGVSTRVLWVVTATVSARAVQNVVKLYFSRRLVPAQRFEVRAIHWPMARELVGYGGWSMVMQVSGTLRDGMDPIILTRYATPLDVATFHVAGIPSRQLRTLAVPLYRPFIPVLATLFAQGDFVRMRSVYLRGARYHSWIMTCVALPAIILADPLMDLYLGGLYPKAGTVMALLLVVPIFLALNALGPATTLAVGEIKSFSLRQVVIHTFNLFATLAFVALLHMGALGSAAATLLATLVVEAALTWPLYHRIVALRFGKWVEGVVVPAFLPALPCAAWCIAARWYWDIDSWLSLLSVSGLSGLIYVGLVLRFSLQDNDREDLEKLVRRLPGPVQRGVRSLTGESTRPTAKG